ncbi:hypothetical protein EB001_14785 [bacterium]|nr:hypothetical protein [bacterium]
MKISYSTNFMGPISLDWFRDNGFTKRVTKILEKDSLISDNKKGDVVEYDEITEHWMGGRIDIGGTDDQYGIELALPTMKQEDWVRFSEWLWTFRTDKVWGLNQIVEEYEKTNPKIRWFKNRENSYEQ